MENLNEQLLDLKMGDAISKQNMMVDPGMDGDGGPNAPSPSEPSAATSTAKRGLRSRLKAEKHQVKGNYACVYLFPRHRYHDISN